MLILGHVVVALASVAYSTYFFARPSRGKLAINYGLIVLTLVSGVFLVTAHPAQMLRACISGGVYLAIVTTMTYIAQRHLAVQMVADK